MVMTYCKLLHKLGLKNYANDFALNEWKEWQGCGKLGFADRRFLHNITIWLIQWIELRKYNMATNFSEYNR